MWSWWVVSGSELGLGWVGSGLNWWGRLKFVGLSDSGVEKRGKWLEGLKSVGLCREWGWIGGGCGKLW